MNLKNISYVTFSGLPTQRLLNASKDNGNGPTIRFNIAGTEFILHKNGFGGPNFDVDSEQWIIFEEDTSGIVEYTRLTICGDNGWEPDGTIADIEAIGLEPTWDQGYKP